MHLKTKEITPRAHYGYSLPSSEHKKTPLFLEMFFIYFHRMCDMP